MSSGQYIMGAICSNYNNGFLEALGIMKNTIYCLFMAAHLRQLVAQRVGNLMR